MRLVILPAVLAAALALSGCKSADERAEEYYQSGLTYLAQGDEERALIELRNVFLHNGLHKEARRTYADLVLKRGGNTEAYGQYLRLIEQYPDDVEVRRILAEMAIQGGNWPEAERHGNAALELAPDAIELQPVRLTLAYRTAVLERDGAARAAVAAEAEALLGTAAKGSLLQRILIDWRINQQDDAGALALVDEILAGDPAAFDMHSLRYMLLMRSGDTAAIGAQLRRMVETFPENAEVRSALLAWYVQQSDLDGAEAFLRELAGGPDSPVEGHLSVVDFLAGTRGPEAARAELERLIAGGGPHVPLYGTRLAVMDYAEGKRTEAIAAIRALLTGAEASDQTRRIQIILAQMLNAEDQRAAARELVATVLGQDSSHVDALKLRAAWAIDEDRPGEAIIDLRAALDQAPRDVGILELMAAAHERDGALDLAGERLAMAVEVSGSAPPQALRYAGFLMRQGRTQVAERVLSDSLRANPVDPRLLQALTEFYIGQTRWAQATETLERLEALALDEENRRAALSLRAAILAGQDRLAESLELLDAGLAGGNAQSAALAAIQARVRAGQITEARALVQAQLEQNPGDPVFRILSGSLDLLLGEPQVAEASWGAVVAENPGAELPVRLLYGLLVSQGRQDEASALLDRALEAGNSIMLRWLKAGELEKAGDVDGAIVVYEALYADDSSNVVIANNLASLLVTHKDDDASLERAERIARRLRGLPQPAFQDTYGWIAFRRGNLDEALSHLEPAARGLTQDPLVQYHLGMLYDRLNRTDDAIRQFEAALALAGRDSALPQMVAAREALARLRPAPAPEESPAEGKAE